MLQPQKPAWRSPRQADQRPTLLPFKKAIAPSLDFLLRVLKKAQCCRQKAPWSSLSIARGLNLYEGKVHEHSRPPIARILPLIPAVRQVVAKQASPQVAPARVHELLPALWHTFFQSWPHAPASRPSAHVLGTLSNAFEQLAAPGHAAITAASRMAKTMRRAASALNAAPAMLPLQLTKHRGETAG